jgi:probable HAF family extracellular repeat protein
LGRTSAARGINASDTVAGLTIDSNWHARATVWQNGRTHFLSAPLDSSGAEPEAYANDINDYGIVTGNVMNNGSWQAFRSEFSSTRNTGSIESLGTLGGSMSFGNAVNNSGTIVGKSLTGQIEWTEHAFIYTRENGMRDIGTLGGAHSSAADISDTGIVVGSAWRSDGVSEAFMYTDQSGMVGLGTLGGHSSTACGINTAGTVVGWWSPDGYTRRAFVWADGEMFDLNNLIDPTTGWTLVEATGINDHGDIVGYGIDPDGVDRSFLLTPRNIPSPTTMSISALLLGICSRKRKR